MDFQQLFAALVSHALSLGIFEAVNTHIPKATVDTGLVCNIITSHIGAFPAGSGLDAVAGLVTMTMEIEASQQQQPYDAIEGQMLNATSAVFQSLAGGFTLGGLIRNIDLEGESGTKLAANPGYLTRDGSTLRVFLITVPMIVNDLWPEVA